MKFKKADKMCFSKHRYPNEIKAKLEALKMQEKYFYTTPLRVYPCPVCRGFHLTST